MSAAGQGGDTRQRTGRARRLRSRTTGSRRPHLAGGAGNRALARTLRGRKRARRPDRSARRGIPSTRRRGLGRVRHELRLAPFVAQQANDDARTLSGGAMRAFGLIERQPREAPGEPDAQGFWRPPRLGRPNGATIGLGLAAPRRMNARFRRRMPLKVPSKVPSFFCHCRADSNG